MYLYIIFVTLKTMEGIMAYEHVTFASLKTKRKETVREKIAAMWAKGTTAVEVSKAVRISPRSAATALGNLTRTYEETPTRRR